MLSVKFWGVRGSIPCPGPETVIYGGNTSCLEIRADERLVIIDLGTGVRLLGEYLAASDLKNYGKVSADIFITHTHWDHIMGFPMFSPIYIPGTELRITGPVSYEYDSLETIVTNILSYKYWPVQAGELAAKIEFKSIREETVDLGGGLCVTSKFINHPILCLGYRIEYQGKSITTVYDHEPYRNLFTLNPEDAGYDEGMAREGELVAAEENEKIVNFIRNSDIVIYDAMYTEEEFEGKKGWGHTSSAYAANSLKDANVKKLVLFHHDPTHTDGKLEQIENSFKGKYPMEIITAKEGMTLIT